MNFQRICVFCGSNLGFNPVYREAATALGELFIDRAIGLVYGGGNVGLMGVLADAMLAKGGNVIGVIPESPIAKEVGHQGVSELRIVKSMHERKALMANLSDGFIALPGGYGTFEEFCEMVTWSQLGLHAKPCGVLNVAGYYDPLLELFDRSVHEGFLRKDNWGLVLEDSNPAQLLAKMTEFHSPASGKWIAEDER